MTDAPNINYLLSARAVRERSGQLYALATEGKLKHFELDLKAFPACAESVVAVIRRSYPNLEVPFHSRWRHFSVGGIDRTSLITNQLSSVDEDERYRTYFDLVILSVLLDAGAGAKWSYEEPGTTRKYNRSEGLAVASFHMFRQGIFGHSHQKLEASGDRLAAMREDELADGMQVTVDNPLEGLPGRIELINRLGRTIQQHPEFFGSPGRLGRFYDYIKSQAQGNSINAQVVLECVLKAFGPIWPGRIQYDGVNLGDVWKHSMVTATNDTEGLVPFHKLSQWLTYSLLEPLIWSGLKVEGIDELTGLAEYRNGGLFIDAGVIVAKDRKILTARHLPSSEVVIEWRALTVILLDKIADLVRKGLDKPKSQFPLVRVLEGGTWAAGREFAQRLRPGGTPPLQILSDGTVF